GVGKQIGPRALAQQVDHRLRPCDIAADGPAQRQRARPYLFSNSLPPAIVAAGIESIRLVEKGDALRTQLLDNAAYWRAGLMDLGFDLLPGEHPIIPVMLGDAQLAQDMAAHLFDAGVYVSGFFFPVVPRGQARIRTQMNAALTRDDLDRGLAAFGTVGRTLGVIQ
ncbi:MAG: aminotransferase class I/II-fold pyridoxal phosphate-dependent enzyme, partial [Pseudomonadota bacterium]